VGVTYQINDEMNLYVNRSQAYRAILFNDYWRPDTLTVVDPNIKDMTGYVYEFGLRGRRTNWFQFDIGGFYLKYHNRLGLLTTRNEQSQTVPFWTNVSDSRNVGLESFIEADLLRLARVDEKKGALSLFGSIATINSRYLGGTARGNRVEFAPSSTIRAGLTYRLSGASATLQFNRVGDQYTDANNTRFTVDGIQGLVPSYQLWDLSGSYNFKKLYILRAGINNLADRHYFNRRGASYPGPGLIPADGRTYYLSFGLRY
jgi:Fe(3+) dicitrate transport protein